MELYFRNTWKLPDSSNKFAANLNMKGISLFYSPYINPVFHFNGIVAKRSYSSASISLVLPECSRNNEIRYALLRYGLCGKSL